MPLPTLVFATNNAHKVLEVAQLLQGPAVISLKDAGYTGNLPEPFATFRENAESKARAAWNVLQRPVFAEDSGICIDALGGAPGVFSARYAGEAATDEQNLALLEGRMKGIGERSAHYHATICFIDNGGSTRFFEGQCRGALAEAPRGAGGFGYDPLFIPEGFGQTFGVLSAEIKATLSHRAKAVAAFSAYLRSAGA